MHLHPDERIIDIFSGGGGASTGILAACGRSPNLVVDYSQPALDVHAANHQHSQGLCDDVFAALGTYKQRYPSTQPVGLLWASPSCTQFSKAKTGSAPLNPSVRNLAWAVVEWARDTKARCIVLENVEEFLLWGPLDESGRPLKDRKGEFFQEWLQALQEIGYKAEWRTLVAADYGAPTTRKRLFLVARNDEAPIAWPKPSHSENPGTSGLSPWRTALEVVDWSLPCPSIFGRKKPLTDATLRRVAEGMRKYVLLAENPHVLAIDEGLATPFIGSHYGQSVGRDIRRPLPTITAGGSGHQLLVIPTLVTSGYGERPGQLPRVPGIHKPLGTVVASGVKHALVWGHLGAADRQDLVVDLLLTHSTLTEEDIASAKARGLLPTDIGMRLLSAKELLLAQGFPADYHIDADIEGNPISKTAQVSAIGNAVCPAVAEAIVRANLC